MGTEPWQRMHGEAHVVPGLPGYWGSVLPAEAASVPPDETASALPAEAASVLRAEASSPSPTPSSADWAIDTLLGRCGDDVQQSKQQQQLERA